VFRAEPTCGLAETASSRCLPRTLEKLAPCDHHHRVHRGGVVFVGLFVLQKTSHLLARVCVYMMLLGPGMSPGSGKQAILLIAVGPCSVTQAAQRERGSAGWLSR
jgi:hypothetical protein